MDSNALRFTPRPDSPYGVREASHLRLVSENKIMRGIERHALRWPDDTDPRPAA